jgi:hypothetical protein
LPIDILDTDYLTGLAGISVGLDQLPILFIAPPWGDAFDRTSGVDLRRTTPPITEIGDFLLHVLPESPTLRHPSLRCFESGIRIALSAELRSSQQRPQ